MNQDFKLRFDQMKEGSPTAKQDGGSNKFETASHVRNLCFIWPDGKMKFLNYAYLVSGEFDVAENAIKLEFTTDIVLIKGVRLEILFEELITHTPKKIICYDQRYNSTMDDSCIVNEIMVLKTE